MKDFEKILNYRMNSEHLSTSGQPTEREIHLLKEAGFKTIINIRPENEMFYVFDEKQIVENLGMNYLQIPMTFETLDANIMSKIFQQIELQQHIKTLIHCHHNIRVSVLFALYRIIKLEWTREEAFSELGKMMEINSMLKDYL